MRIAHVTNYWPNRHGQAHYTQNLMAALQSHLPGRHFVIGEGNTAATDDAALWSRPIWSRHEDYTGAIVRAIREVGADVAYFQYANDLFGDDERFPRTLAAVEAAGTRTIVVTHSVYPPRRRIVAFDRAVGAAASAIHVHSPRMKRELVARGIAGRRIHVIPHGSAPLEQRDPVASRRALGIPETAKVVLFFGFIWTGKGLERLIAAFARLSRRVPDAFLYIGGHTRYRRWGFYVSYLRLRAMLAGAGKRMKLSGGYVPEDAVPTVYSAADVVAMPYRQDYASVSGVVHQTAGMGTLMLCSRIAKFDEVGDISPELLVDPDDTEAWARELERLLVDPTHAEAMRAKIRAFGEATSWPIVGNQHLELCHALVDDRLRLEPHAAGRVALQHEPALAGAER